MKESEVWLRVAKILDAGYGCGLAGAIGWAFIMFPGASVRTIAETEDRCEDVFANERWPTPVVGRQDTPRVLAALFLREMALDDERRAKRGRK